MNRPEQNIHAGKRHFMSSGREVIGVSHSWARAVDDALAETLDASPDLRHVAISVPKAERDVRRLFHSENGLIWSQVHLSNFGPRRYDVGAIVRGAQELDGDPAFDAALNADNLRLREIAGDMLAPRNQSRFRPSRRPSFDSLADWVEARVRPVLDHAGQLYVDGATSEEARTGRRHALVTIERLVRRLRYELQHNKPFVPPAEDRYGTQLQGKLEDFLILRHVPFLVQTFDLKFDFDRLSQARRKDIAKGIWADAARMPRDARFDAIYGALLRQAAGHPIYGDEDYRKLEGLLAADLAAGYRVVRLDGCLFIRSDNRWRPARLAPVTGEANWERGVIISRNFGRVIVPPFVRDGEVIPGYTRNGPGEGPSEPRPEPISMRCRDRPLHDANLHWIHAYHAWEATKVTGPSGSFRTAV